MDSDVGRFVAVTLALLAGFLVLRLYVMMQATRVRGFREDSNLYLSFDDRLAERLRELEREQERAQAAAQPAAEPGPPVSPTPPPREFGRRGRQARRATLSGRSAPKTR